MSKRTRILSAICLILFVASLSLALWGTPSAAATTRPAAGEIPSATLIVGSHIIALSAITDEIAAVAEASAQQYSQNKVYYKSEIDDTWYDITNSASVHGTPVQNSVIDAIPTLTHWTKSDGKTYDLETGGAVKINEISDLARPTTITQANPITTQIEVLENLARNEKDESALAAINAGIAIMNDMMQDIDAQAAQSQYSQLKSTFSMYNGNSYDQYEIILWYKALKASATAAELRTAVIERYGIRLEDVPAGATAEQRNAIQLRNETKVAGQIAQLDAMAYGSTDDDEEDGEEAELAAAKRKAELQAYYRISAKQTEAQVAGEADLPGKKKAIAGYDDFVIYLRGNGEKDSTIELAVGEKAQLQAVYDTACVTVMIDRLNSGISRAKLNQAEDVSSVLTDVLNAYQDMLGDLEEVARGEPEMVLDEMFEEQAGLMTTAVGGGSFPRGQTELQALAHINNCIEMRLVNPEAELEVLLEAIPRSLEKINTYFKAGESKLYSTEGGTEVRSYQAAKGAGNTSAVLAGLQKTGISANRALLDEHSMLLGLHKERAVVESHNEALQGGIQNLTALSRLLPADDFKSDNYQLLMDALDALYAALGEGERLLDDDYQRQLDDLAFLEAMLQSLNNQYIEAMMAGDYDLAASLQAEIDALLDMGVGGSEDTLSEYLDLSGRAALIESLLETAEGDEADRLRAELRDIRGQIAALKELDPFIAALEDAGGVAQVLLGDGSDFITDDSLTFVELYGLAVDGGVREVLSLADTLQAGLDGGRMDDGTAAMMAPLVERLLMRAAIESGMLDSDGLSTAESVLRRTILEIMANELQKYTMDERTTLAALSEGFGKIGHNTGSMAAGSVILGYNQMKFTVPTIRYMGEAYVPIAEAFGYFGGHTTHLEGRDRVVVQLDTLLIELTAGKTEAYVGDLYAVLPAPVLDYNRVLYVPASFVAEQLGIQWEYVEQHNVFIFYSFDY